MEFPQVGQHCSAKTCNKLDHIKYNEHQCPSSYRKNIQIPICPLCNQHVPYEYRDQSPDRAVSGHIDRDCQSRKRDKVYSNKCSVSSCKQREAIQVNCEKCSKTYCLRHRFPDDHKCQGLQKVSSSAKQKTQEEDDYLFAKALQESEREELQRTRRNQTTAATTTANNNSASSTDNKNKIMDFGEPSPDVIARLYKEIKEKKILELDWKNPGKKNRTKRQKVEQNLSPMKSDESTNSKTDDNKLVNEIDEFDNDDALRSNHITVSSFRSAVGKPKTNEKRLIDMNTVIANIERQQQEDERLRQGMDTSSDDKA
ncbi:hypothetical protein I4U23_023959 [Adineta vaga]|nr:hypothetical protein I4U23_023959 [Adineta vaga]